MHLLLNLLNFLSEGHTSIIEKFLSGPLSLVSFVHSRIQVLYQLVIVELGLRMLELSLL